MGIYIDDCLIIAPSDTEVAKVYRDLKTKSEVTNEGPPSMSIWVSRLKGEMTDS